MVLGCDSEPGMALLDALLNEQRSTQQLASAVGVAGTDCGRWMRDPRFTFLKCPFGDEQACSSLIEHISMYAPDIIVFSPSVLSSLKEGQDMDWASHEMIYRVCLLFSAQLCWWLGQKPNRAKFILVSGERLEDVQAQRSYDSATSGMESLVHSFQKNNREQFQVFKLSNEGQMSLGSIMNSDLGEFQTRYQADARKLISLALGAPKNSFHKTV